ncbi:MAG: adhesin [Candidatus Binatia bacterium]|nr:MAG: adhesin [Candidatus Binatia bacterium]
MTHTGKHTRFGRPFSFVVAACFLFASGFAYGAAAAPLRVCATTSDLGALAREVGGEDVEVVVFAKPTEDPHFVEAKPSFVKELHRAAVFVQVGMDLELGWVPALLRNARNPKILPGQPGYIDASTVIRPLEVPAGEVTRALGDIHVRGNPHYLTDPLNGLRVAELLRDRLSVLQPEKARLFAERTEDFRRRVGAALVGQTLAAKYDFEKLARLHEYGKLASFLREQGEEELLGGWLGTLAPHYGTKAVADHNLWPYFARRFGLVLVGFMEPKPGIAPTTKHLAWLVERMRAERVNLVLAAVYYDPRHAAFLARETGARIVPMAHAVGSRPGTETYLAFVDYNVRKLAAAIEGAD